VTGKLAAGKDQAAAASKGQSEESETIAPAGDRMVPSTGVTNERTDTLYPSHQLEFDAHKADAKR